jgi:hypothetical protein
MVPAVEFRESGHALALHDAGVFVERSTQRLCTGQRHLKSAVGGWRAKHSLGPERRRRGLGEPLQHLPILGEQLRRRGDLPCTMDRSISALVIPFPR